MLFKSREICQVVNTDDILQETYEYELGKISCISWWSINRAEIGVNAKEKQLLLKKKIRTNLIEIN